MTEKTWAFAVRGEGTDSLEVDIYDIVGDGLFGGVSAASVRDRLKANPQASAITVRINSSGGDVWDGLAIYSQLQSHPGNVTVYVDGLAASIASAIAMAGDEIVMAEGAFMMIHNPYAPLMLGADAQRLRKKADQLDKVRDVLADIYISRTEQPREEVVAAMAAETWMNAQDAKNQGYATKIYSPSKKKGKAAAAASPESRCTGWNLDRFANVPEAVRVAAQAMSTRPPEELETLEGNAIPYKKYPLDEKDPWDAAQAEANVRKWASSDGSGDADTIDWTKYGWAFTWVDNENRETFGAYKLPHHDVDNDAPGAGQLETVRAGVIAAGNAVSGSRGGTSIPAADLPAVKAHLEKHYHEFGLKAPWEGSQNSAQQAPANAKTPRESAQLERTIMSDLTTTIRALLGLSAGAPDSDCTAAISRVRDLEREAMSLTGAKSTEEAIGCIRAMKAKADESEKLGAELAKIRGERDQQNFETQITRGQAERKLTPAVAELYKKEFDQAAEHGNGAAVVDRLRGFLNAAPVVIPVAPRPPAPLVAGGGSVPQVPALKWNDKTYAELQFSQRAQLASENPELWRLMKDDWEARGAA